MPRLTEQQVEYFAAQRIAARKITDEAERKRALKAITDAEFEAMGPDEGIEGIRARYNDDRNTR